MYRSLDGKKVDVPEDEVQGEQPDASLTDGPETPSACADWNSLIQFFFMPPRGRPPLVLPPRWPTSGGMTGWLRY